MVSGACIKVAYGYSQRGNLQPNDAAWFRQQFFAYGPIPVASVFGPAFRRYVGDTNGWKPAGEEGDILGDTMKHHRELREVVDKMPGSIWAPSAAELLGRLTGRQGTTVEQRVSVFQRVADAYPASPYVDVALREKARIYDGAELRDQASREYAEMLSRRPRSPFRSEALRYIVGNEGAHGNWDEVIKRAREWAEVAPVHEKFAATLAMMEAFQAKHDAESALKAARQTLDAVKEFRKALRSNQLGLTESARLKHERSAADAEGKARAVK
jgi:hypothetical protein